eukprot:snap_masked-scaffold23_size669530-processed-gene-1.7 protein:Tk11053 transcript:snap_masked-scaffold23_size669530-processed-gene-1.7-mRNA-1 annotation:"hypothetical protein CAPTEDRAFT_164291"
MAAAIPTPDLSHLTWDDYEHVYEPAEDSFLFLDALELELDALRRLRPTLCLEVGSGSGVISTGLASVLPACLFLCTDLNPWACRASRRTAQRNGVQLEVSRQDAALQLEPRLAGQVDIFLCNPPYVATFDAETGSHDLAAAWAGGSRGLDLTWRLLEALPRLLSPTGVAYLVLEQCNQPERLEAQARALGLNHVVVLRRRAGRELLSVLKLARRPRSEAERDQ